MTRRNARGTIGRTAAARPVAAMAPETPTAAGREPAEGGSVERRAAEGDVADRLHSAAIHLLRRLRREDEAAGLTAPRLSALSVLVFGGARTLGELAAAEQVKPPTMSRLVRALERDGWVAREADTADGRVVWLRATPAGVRVVEEGRRRRIASFAQLLRGLEPGELAALGEGARVLERLLRESR